MSISINNWVDINSKVNKPSVRDRQLILRIVTDNNKLTPDKVVEMTGIDEVVRFFGSEATETSIAMKYFSYVSNQATKPSKISFWRPGYFTATEDFEAKKSYYLFDNFNPAGEPDIKIGDRVLQGTKLADDLITSLTKSVDASDNFGTFIVIGDESFVPQIIERSSAPIPNEEDNTQYITDQNSTWQNQWANSANAISLWNATYNNKFRYVFKVDIKNLAKQIGSITWEKVAAAEGVDKSINNDADTYLGRIANSGTTAVLDDYFVNPVKTMGVDEEGHPIETVSYVSTNPEWLTCAILAATKYERTNSTLIQEFKGVDLPPAQMLVTCENDSLYRILTNLNVNFYGQTQKAGKVTTFLMGGFNLDGDDTSIYDNEMWLKDRVVTTIMNRFTSCNKIPAGATGRAMIRTAVLGALEEAINNETILLEKSLSEEDKAAIIQNTGATDAPASIYSNGYYLDIREGEVLTDGSARRRTVEYVLYYSSGEGIRKVEGSHVLV